MKILPKGVELFHADERTDRQTDVTKLIVAFHNFTNAPKNKGMSTIKLGYLEKIQYIKFTLEQALKAQSGSRDLVPLFL
jgi:hypothetical protein